MEIMTLADFFSSSDPVSVCVLLYGIILIQILIKYNVKNLITACTRLHDSDPKIEKSPYRGRGRGTPPSHTLPRSVASLPRICSQNIFFVFLEVKNHPPPPHF